MTTRPENRFTLRDNALKEEQPWGVIPDPDTTLTDGYTYKPLKGDWLRVFPRTGKDVAFLAMLEHRVDKFAPSHGHGALVKADLLR